MGQSANPTVLTMIADLAVWGDISIKNYRTNPNLDESGKSRLTSSEGLNKGGR